MAAAVQADLLAWPDLRDAEEAARAADAAWHAAQRGVLYAPRGKRKEREASLRDASQKALRAALELQRQRRALRS